MATTHATTSAAGAGLEGADEALTCPIASLRAGLEGADEAFTSPISFCHVGDCWMDEL